MAFMKNGSKHISKLIENGIKNGTRTAIVVGDWEIESAVRIPSNFKLILDSCHLIMADGVFDNMFINEHYGTDICRTTEGTDRNISIIGRGNAILDGGNYNGLSEANAGKDGMPSIYKNNLMLFNNVDGFEIRNISLHNQRWWAVNLIYCSNGEITDIKLKANDTCIDKDGNVYHGLSVVNYYDMLVKQADGIDIRQGCHHIFLENISGFAGDDVIALTALNGKMEKTHSVEGLPMDMCYIKVKNVKAEALSSCVRILNQGGFSMHHILVDGVVDVSDQTDYLNEHGVYCIHIGDIHNYGERHATEEEMYNISIKNVRSRADYALCLAGNKIKNFSYENIVCFDGGGYIQDLRELTE